MPAWAIPAISAGASLLQSYLGRKQRTEMGLSPEAQKYLQMLYGQLEEGAPSYLTSPIKQQYGALKAGISEGVGEALSPGSGLEMGQLQRATAGESRALGEVGERHRASTLRAIASILGRTGTQETTMPFDIGAPAEDIGYAIWMATHGGKGGLGAGFKGKYSDPLHQFTLPESAYSM